MELKPLDSIVVVLTTKQVLARTACYSQRKHSINTSLLGSSWLHAVKQALLFLPLFLAVIQSECTLRNHQCTPNFSVSSKLWPDSPPTLVLKLNSEGAIPFTVFNPFYD